MVARTNLREVVSRINKRVVFMAAGLTVATVLGFTALAGPGAAVASASSGALVIDDLGCRLLDGNGRITYASSSHVVITESANGNRVAELPGAIAGSYRRSSEKAITVKRSLISVRP